MQLRSKLFFFTALPCEAKPLIAHFGLKKEMAVQEFSLYRNAEYCLTVTGLGKTAMAAGTAYTLALMTKVQNPVMINIGVAGHENYSLGEIFIAEKITDGDSGRSFYPQLIYDIPCRTESICTVSRPHDQYEQNLLYDMEASAFYETAVRFTTGELIQSLKVISDNASSPPGTIQAKQVSALIVESLGILEKLMSEMTALQRQIETTEPKFYQQAVKTWHFTVSEQLKLKNALLRWDVLMDGKPPEIDESAMQKGKDVLRWLEKRMAEIDFKLD